MYITFLYSGGGSVDLVSGGNQVEVGTDNVLDFVKRYAEYRMVTNSRKALQVGYFQFPRTKMHF